MNLILHYLPALVAALAGWACGAWATALAIQWAHRADVLDAVNERSSHSTPTPRLGGFGILAGVLAGVAAACATEAALRALGIRSMEVWTQVARPSGVAVLAAGVLAFALGLWDDRANLSPLPKLAGQLVAAGIPAVIGLAPGLIVLPGFGPVVLSPAAGVAIAAAWLLLLMNVVNFMDGINGLAGRFAQVAAVGLALGVFNWSDFAFVVACAAALYGGAEGFLVHNLAQPRARTFMGDCGSHLVGALVAALSLAAMQGRVNFPLATMGFGLLVAPFVFDVLFTLARRARRSQPLWKAHREHLYQRLLVARGEAHGPVLSYVTTHLWVAALGAGIIINTGWGRWSQGAAWAALLLAVGLCFSYWRGVRAAEDARP